MDNRTMADILNRRSIRKFTDESLTEDEIRTLADAALASPSGMNGQPWSFHFILNKGVIRTLSEAAIEFFREQGNVAVLERIQSRHESLFYGAPLVVIVTIPKSQSSDVDVGIAVENIALAAQSLGLGSCIIGLASGAFSGSQADKSFKLLDISADRKFSLSVAVGHAAMTKEAHETHPEKIVYVR